MRGTFGFSHSSLRRRWPHYPGCCRLHRQSCRCLNQSAYPLRCLSPMAIRPRSQRHHLYRWSLTRLFLLRSPATRLRPLKSSSHRDKIFELSQISCLCGKKPLTNRILLVYAIIPETVVIVVCISLMRPLLQSFHLEELVCEHAQSRTTRQYLEDTCTTQ